MDMARKELQDRQAKYDAFVSSIGQKEAKRYLAAREQPPTRGNIRASIAFVILTALILVIFLAL
jgi:hypothetical protein